MKRFFKCFTKKDSHKLEVLVKEPQKLEVLVKEPWIPNITWQHIWSYDEAQNALSQSLFSFIPNEIILNIFKFFSIHDLCNISLVCRRFKMIADQDEIWKLKCNSMSFFFFFSNIMC